MTDSTQPNAQQNSEEINRRANTSIENIGECTVHSPLPFCEFINDTPHPFFLDNEFLGGRDTTPTLMHFELAGARSKVYFDPYKTKCAVVTCGGLCPGINDVIRAITMESHHAYNVSSVIGIRYGLQGFIPKYKHDIVELTPDRVNNIHRFGGTILGSSRGPQSPTEIIRALERLNVNILFMIGGDGTLKAASAIAKEAQALGLKIAVVGIPKTIDNDINFVYQSFGFESAVDKATEAIQCAHVEALGAHNGIGIVKLMGRESGFIAAHATISIKEANFVLIPETPFAMHGERGLLTVLEKRLERKKNAVIVLAEGAGQHLLSKGNKTDASGNPVLADIGEYLRNEVKEYFEAKNIPVAIKYIDPSYIIRSVPANANDRVYCGLLGQYAVHAAMAGKTSMVVTKLMDRYVHLPLELVTAMRRKLNIESAYWRAVLEATGQAGLEGMLSPEHERFCLI